MPKPPCFDEPIAAKSNAMGAGGEPSMALPCGATFVSGAFAGALSRTCTAPLERLKFMQQVGQSVDGVACLYRRGGMLALFRGNSANVLKTIPEMGIKFTAFEATQSWQRSSRGAGVSPGIGERLVAGALAGATSCVFTYPLEVVRTRMSIGPHYRGVADCAMQLARLEGPRVFWQGFGASLLGIMPFCAIDLTLYSASKECLTSARGGAEPSSVDLLCVGAFSSAVAQVVTYPLALARTLLQAQGLPGHPTYTGVVDALAQTVQRGGGVRALFRGLRPNMFKAVPSLSMTYVVFEATKKRLLADE